MTLAIGDIVTVTVIEVLPYACWSEVNGQIVFTHCMDWSIEKPVPDEKCPQVSQKLRAKVFHIVDKTDEPPTADITLDGKYRVDLAATFALIESAN